MITAAFFAATALFACLIFKPDENRGGIQGPSRSCILWGRVLRMGHGRLDGRVHVVWLALANAMTNTPTHSKALTLQDIASDLAVSQRTVARLCAKGELVAYKVGRQWRVQRHDYLHWLRCVRVGSWRQFTSVEIPGGSASNGEARKSESRLAQLLKARPDSISQTSKRSAAG